MTFPAGTYWIGDLCYVMDAEWDEVCDLTISDDNPCECVEGEFTLKDGRRFAIYNTMYGDGTYPDQYGFKYGVDSGSIGCIRLEDIRGGVSEEGSIVVFSQQFETGEKNGVIRIGHIEIDTDPQEETEEFDEEYE